MRSYYFDYNATTPLAPEVFEAMAPFFAGQFGNPSSPHHVSRGPIAALRGARRKVAELLGARDEDEILFTSGGTESNNAVLRSALASNPQKRVLVTSAVEHSSVRTLCHQLEKEGYGIRYMGVDRDGNLDLAEIRASLSDDVALVSLMMANNETGVVFPVEEIGRAVKERGILFHCDAVQAAGRLPLNVREMPVDFLTLSAHKFCGPKGAGAVYAKKGSPWRSSLFGGSQERGRRAGTENVPAIVGLGAASELALRDLSTETARLSRLRDSFESRIRSEFRDTVIHGENARRIPNTSFISFRGIDGEALLFALDQEGICVSRGSACMSGSQEPSYVLKAMGFSDDVAGSAIRFSFGRYTHEEEISFLLEALEKIVNRLRSLAVTP